MKKHENAITADRLRPVTTERFEDYISHHREIHDREMLALTNARQSIDYRLEGMNELRNQINSERGKFVDRTLFDIAEKRIGELEQKSAAASSQTVAWVTAIGIIFAVIQLLLKFVG